MLVRRLAEIVKGTTGYKDISRGSFRMQGGCKYICDGTQKTCLQDSIVVAARWAGAEVVKSKVHDDLATDGELRIDVAVCYVRETVRMVRAEPCMHHDIDCVYVCSQLLLAMVCLTAGPASLTRLSHGVAYQLMQIKKGAIIVCLEAKLIDGTRE